MILKPFFVEIPPDWVPEADDLRYPFTDLRESQERYKESLFIQTMCTVFKETHDPIALMKAFVASMNLGIYPPVTMLQALSAAFQRVLEVAAG